MHIGPDPPAKLRVSPLERAVLQAVAAALGPAGIPIATQAALATVAARTHSGVGFVTRLRVADDTPHIPEETVRRIRVVTATHPALAEPAEFLVQVRDGRLATIEAFCGAGMWPPDETGFQVARPGVK